MSPILALPSSMPAYNLTPRMELLPSEGLPTPDIQAPKLDRPQGLREAQPAGDSFASMLGRMVAEVNAKQNVASEAVSALQSGQNVPLHQAVIAMEEASVSFQLMVEVRNKLLESYQELMRMQI